MRAIRWSGSCALIAVVVACKGHSTDAPATKQGSAAAVAPAVPADAAAAPPDAGLACIPAGPIVAAATDGGHLRICSDSACVDADPTTGVIQSTPHVKLDEPALVAAKVEPRDKKLVACFHDKCRDIGKNARALIDRDPDVHNDRMAATTDLRSLVIPKVSPQLWEIGGDREIKLRAPDHEQDLSDMRPVGDHIYAVWLPASAAMYTRSGQLVSPLPDGTKLAMIDDARSVALTRDLRVIVFDAESHPLNLAESIGYTDWLAPSALAVLADQTVVVVASRQGGEASVILIDPQRGTVFRRWPLPLCPG